MTAGELIRIEAIVFVAGVAIAVFWKLLTGAIVARGLINDKISGEASPARLQLMVSTLLAAAFYAQAIVASRDFALPQPNDAILAVVGGSNIIHLGDKFWKLLKLARSLRR
jgi:Kef-type K+ transport system membrane component KefB